MKNARLTLCCHQDFSSKMGKRVGLGMNKFELAQNKQLSEYVVQNLNKNPQFPFPDNTFDVVTCVVSIDYLNKPLEIFKEVRRVLRPGGRFIVSQSNRCFPTKAIQIWLNTNVGPQSPSWILCKSILLSLQLDRLASLYSLALSQT